MKVFITGMGAVSSLGNSVGQMFEGLRQGKSAIQKMPHWAQYNGLFSHIGAPVPAYDISKVPRQARRTMSRMSEMATLATVEALSQADLVLTPEVHTPRIALCMGSTTGSPETFENYFKKFFEKGGPEGSMGTTFFKVMNHTVPANVAAALGFHGPTLSPSSACATSAHAMVVGWELLQTGLYDIVIAGGADELNHTSAAVFDIVFAASRGYNDRPEIASRPFDRDRDGLVVSEGAGVVVLETEESAKRRGIQPRFELKSGAHWGDGTHLSQTDAATMSEVMALALDRARIKPSEIDYVNAHATATRQGDPEETAAVGQVFGKQMLMSSLKGHMGHSLAACGALEAIASCKMMEEETLIATRNLQNVDPACEQVTHLFENRPFSAKNIVSNNFAFGGVNTTLVISYLGNQSWSRP